MRSDSSVELSQNPNFSGDQVEEEEEKKKNNNDEETRRILQFDAHGVFDPPERTRGQHFAFASNHIKTSKYTVVTFVPYNLFEQLVRPANFYFCIIAALQSIPPVSISQGKPTILLPLMFVFIVTAIKDLMEDLKRHKEDKEENKREIEVLRWDGSIDTIKSEDIKVGDIVRIRDGQSFPADLLLITSANGHKAPYCWVETSNIDGETNLKLKQSPEGFNTLLSFDGIRSDLAHISRKMTDRASESFSDLKKRLTTSHINADPPDGQLDHWQGMIKDMRVMTSVEKQKKETIQGNNKKQKEQSQEFEMKNIVVNADNLLVRGSELRNSDWIYGLVIYTGFECKIFMNNQSRKFHPAKRSSVEKQMNRFIYSMAVAQLTICVVCAVLSGDWFADNSGAWYLDNSQSAEWSAFYKFFTWFIIFAQFIPISLLVSMEMVKYLQAFFMQWDINMYVRLHGKEDKFCNVQNSGLNEELGQIQYVFSDKTGTLTENSLDFRKCCIGMETFGQGETEIGRAAKRRAIEMNDTSSSSSKNIASKPRKYSEEQIDPNHRSLHVNFDEYERLHDLLYQSMTNDSKPSQQAEMVRRFLTVLALNNSCYPVRDEDTGELIIRAASPDDECLTCFANFMGVKLMERNPPRVELAFENISNNQQPILEEWEQLAELEFTSKRKRMTVIVRNKRTGLIHVMMKGADSEMVRFISQKKGNPFWEKCEEYLEKYSEEGLRTLVIGEAIKDGEWWEKWHKKYLKNQEETLIATKEENGHLKGSCGNECRICMFFEELEMDVGIELLGATAIEDKLQESVAETISALLDAQINVWMLTGDKQKTAENIGIACNLLEPAMERDNLLFRLTTENRAELFHLMKDAIQKIKEDKTTLQNAGMVVSSSAMYQIMSDVIDDYDLMAKFLQLAKMCKSVLGVRLQPNQKAQVVELIKNHTKSITLAIGDGANDEPMIRAANVGVGIAGLEGTAAVRASDYAIAKFKFLKRLLFVHGRLHYRRITTLICYIFYKNGLLSLSSFWFGFRNGFSGQIMYLEWAYQLYNVAFTAFPIILFAVIDRDYDDNVLLKSPQLYAQNLGGKLFTRQRFLAWILDSFYESCVLTWIPFWCYAYVTSPDDSGQSHGIWSFGVVAYTGIVFCANLRLAFITTSWTAWMHLVIWGSILVYFICMVILNTSSVFANAGADYYWVVFRMMETPRYWLTTLLSVIAALFAPFSLVTFLQLKYRFNYQANNSY